MTTDSTDKLESADIYAVLKSLPHRYPFLLIDRIVAINGIDSCIGIKNVSINEPQFQGHFPGQPVFPGVLIVEAMAQTAGYVIIYKSEGAKPKSVFLMTVDEAKFRRPVVPGDRMELHMERIKTRRDMHWYRGEAMVDGALVAEGIVSAKLVREE